MRRNQKGRSGRLRLAATATTLISLLASTSGSALATNRRANYGHWNRIDTAIAQVYFVDHTGTYWPVNAATIEWNKSANVGVYYSSPGNCPFNCVHTYEVNNHFKPGNVYINLNTSVSQNFGLNQNQRQGVACQEQGHVIGLGHRQYTDDCMYDKDNQYFPKLPSNPHDYNVLANIYDH